MGTASERGQSDVLGDVLLVGIVVVLAVMAILTALTVLEDSETTDLATLGSTASADNITITHVAGRPLEVENATAILRQDGSEWRIPLSEFDRVSGSGDLTAGDQLRHSHSAAPGTVTLLVVDEQANSVVHEAELTVPRKDG